MSEISDFIEYLSWRMKDENDLSDITWSFCESSEEFRNLFLTFFFGNDKYNWNKVTEFKREYSRAGSRPDFYFKNEGVEYIIEVKINDRNQHFEQYNKKNTFENAIKGYITNYKLNNYSGYSLKTWEDFRNYIKNSNLKINRELLDGYINYLDNVCSIKEIKQMKLKAIESLYHFHNALDKIIECDNDNYFYTRYTQTDKSSDIRQGRCFQLNFKKLDIGDIWGWIGLYFNEQTVLCIEFDKNEGWGLPVFKILDSCDNHNEGIFASKPYEEDGAYYFDLLENQLQKFESTDIVENQIEILNSFFQEVIKYVETKASH